MIKTMSDMCSNCEKWKNHKKEVLENSDSIFEAHQDMIIFEEQCFKTCPFLSNSSEK
jgi:hypothetical protein